MSDRHPGQVLRPGPPPSPSAGPPLAFADRQRAWAARAGDGETGILETGVMVVMPSITFPLAELVKIAGFQHYEERLLYLCLLLSRPDLTVVYPTTLPIDEAVVDYYLSFLPDPDGARRRLRLMALDDPEPGTLTGKLLADPGALERLRDLSGPLDRAWLLPFNVTPLELELSDRLGLPLFGPHPDLVRWGSKSGGRRAAARAGVEVVDGAEDLWSVEEVEAAVARLTSRRSDVAAVVIKLNNGFSGQGNAIVRRADLATPLTQSPATFCASEESWPSFAAKIAAEGAVVEELVRAPGVVSPSVQLRLDLAGRVEVVSTHDQLLGGPDDQVYLGCRFPARPAYRDEVRQAAERVGAVLAAEGVVGPFGIDFLVVPRASGFRVTLSEINLRMGGTTHPFGMARLATGGSYDRDRGELVAGGRAKSYVATDNLKSPSLVGRGPEWAIDTVARAGLGFDSRRGTGATLHLLGALPAHGKMGMTCIADSPEEADELYRETSAALGAVAP